MRKDYWDAFRAIKKQVNGTKLEVQHLLREIGAKGSIQQYTEELVKLREQTDKIVSATRKEKGSYYGAEIVYMVPDERLVAKFIVAISRCKSYSIAESHFNIALKRLKEIR